MAANVITALNLRIGFNVSEFETAQRTIRQSTARAQQILKSMEGPMEKFANDIAAVNAAAKEEGWSQEKLLSVYDHLDKKYDVTGKYARQTARAKEELANVTRQETADQKLLASLLQQSETAMDRYENGIAALQRELQRTNITTEQYTASMRYLHNEFIKAPALARADARALQEKKIAEQAAEQAAKELAQAQQRLNDILKLGQTEVDVYKQKIQLLDKDYQSNLITFEEYNIAMRLLTEKYIDLPARIEQTRMLEQRSAQQMAEKTAILNAVRQVQNKVSAENDAYIVSVNALFTALRAGVIELQEFKTTLADVDNFYTKTVESTDDLADRMQRLSDEAKAVNESFRILGIETKKQVSAQDEYEMKLDALNHLKGLNRISDDQYIDGLQKIQQGLLQSQIQFDKLTKKKQVDNAVTQAATIRTNNLAKEIDGLVAKHNEDTAAMQRRIQRYQRLNGEINNHSAATRDAARELGGFISIYGAFAAAKAGLRVAAEMEQAQIAIKVLASSAAEGQKVFEEVRDFAAASPITFESAQKATTTLMQFGMSGQEAVEMLQMLGDASAGNSQRLEGLALAFAQSSAAGRLTGQETLQMVNQGFSPLQQMAEDMAKELGGLASDHFPKLKAAMEQGLISFDDVKNSLVSATSEGGRFAGMTEEMAKTLTGNFNQARDSVARMAFQISEALKPALIDGLKLFKQLTDIVTGLFTPAESLVGTIGQFVGITAGATAVVGTLISIMKTFGIVTKAINVLLVIRNALMNPVALVAGLAIAATAVYGMSQAVAAETAALEENSDATDAAGGAATKYASGLKAAAKSQLTYAEQLEQKYIDIMKPLSAQLYALRHSAEATRREELAKQGLLQHQIDNVIQVEKEIAMLKEKQDIEQMYVDRAKDQLQTEKQINEALANNVLTRKEAASKLLDLEDKRLEKIKELADAGKSIQEKYNPVAKVAEQLAQLNTLLATGNITQEQFFRERNKMLFDNIKKLDMTQPEAMEAGSAQAAQFMQKMVVDEAQQQINELKAQTLLQQASLQAQQETNRRLAELKPVQLIR